MADQGSSPYTALPLVPDVTGPDDEVDVTCLEAWGK